MTPRPLRILITCLVLAGFSAAQAETRVPYRARISKNCAATGGLCSAPSAVVPANRRIELENVSCVVQLFGGVLVNAYIYTSPAPVVYHYLTQTWSRSGFYNFSEQTGIFATAGQRFIAEIYGDAQSSYSITCSLYGDQVVLP